MHKPIRHTDYAIFKVTRDVPAQVADARRVRIGNQSPVFRPVRPSRTPEI